MSLPNMLKGQHCDNEREKKERKKERKKQIKPNIINISMIAFYCRRLVRH